MGEAEEEIELAEWRIVDEKNFEDVVLTHREKLVYIIIFDIWYFGLDDWGEIVCCSDRIS